jgi:hypothetical protein
MSSDTASSSSPAQNELIQVSMTQICQIVLLSFLLLLFVLKTVMQSPDECLYFNKKHETRQRS